MKFKCQNKILKASIPFLPIFLVIATMLFSCKKNKPDGNPDPDTGTGVPTIAGEYTWVRINGDDHQYGSLANGQFIIGDMNIFGRVYRSTAGRRIVYREKKIINA